MAATIYGMKPALALLPNVTGAVVLHTHSYAGSDWSAPRTDLEYSIEAYNGLVLAVHHIDGHWDNWNDPGHDVALVWLDGSVESLHGRNGFAKVDASADVQAAYKAYLVAKAAREEAEAEERDQRFVRRGKMVVVARGRKVPKGTEGEVFWIGNNGYGDSVGIVLADGSKVFTALKNVDVKLGPDGAAMVAPKAAKAPAAIPAGLAKGALVSVKGSQARVFWVGQAKNGSGLRVGVEFSNGNKDFLAANAVDLAA